jgi:hypothetical protein
MVSTPLKSLSPRVHAPVALLQVPSAPHVTRGAGVPNHPLLQVAVQLEPAVVFVGQLKAPPSGLSGALLHTACRNGSKAGCYKWIRKCVKGRLTGGRQHAVAVKQDLQRQQQ